MGERAANVTSAPGGRNLRYATGDNTIETNAKI